MVTLYNGMDAAETSTVSTQPDLISFCSIPRTRQEIAEFLGIKTPSYAIRQYVMPLLEAGKLKMTIPDRPGSPKQMYYRA